MTETAIEVFGKYVAVLKTPGALRFSVAGFMGRAQMSMIGLGAVLLLQSERGSYAIAGAVSAIYALSMAVISPQASRLIDIFGQRIILRIQLALHVPLMAVLIALAMTSVPVWVLYLLAFFSGGVQPNIGALVRARWAVKLTGRGSLRTAFAWESMLDEVIFVVGPPLATFLVIAVFPSAAMIVATVVLAVGVWWFASLRDTEPKPVGRNPNQRRQRPAIALPGVAAVALCYVFVGGIFGSFEVTTVAFADQHGHRGIAGLLLAMNSLGSLTGGLIFGALTVRASLLKQFGLMLGLLAVVVVPLPLLTSIPLLAIGALVAGVAVAPVLISGMALIERIVPAARLTESMSWPSAGLAVGLAFSSPIAGVIVDGNPASTAYWVTVACATGAALTGLTQIGPLRRANRAAAARIAAGRQVAPDAEAAA
ncbi:MAG: MFS transporter [Nakamurella sp.]